ncbi:hypothetical protein GCM10025734_45190 [Kitasatospora paranensis]
MSRPRFWDPDGERFGLPTFPWRMAPDGYLTRRQLRARGLRPGGQPVAAQILWRSRRSGVRAAYLYRTTLAKPVRPMTPPVPRRSPRRTGPAVPARPVGGTPDTSCPPTSVPACPAPTASRSRPDRDETPCSR